MAELDLFFQIWLSELRNISEFNVNVDLLYESYKDGLTPLEAYYLHIYLPF